jgi:hypothetical protein
VQGVLVSVKGDKVPLHQGLQLLLILSRGVRHMLILILMLHDYVIVISLQTLTVNTVPMALAVYTPMLSAVALATVGFILNVQVTRFTVMPTVNPRIWFLVGTLLLNSSSL